MSEYQGPSAEGKGTDLQPFLRTYKTDDHSFAFIAGACSFCAGFLMGDDRKQAFVAFACSTMATFIPGIKTQSDLNSHLALGRG